MMVGRGQVSGNPNESPKQIKSGFNINNNFDLNNLTYNLAID